MKLFVTRQRIKTKEKLNVIFAAYNSLTNFRLRRFSYSAVSKKTGIKLSTVTHMLMRFKECLYDVPLFLK
jgi:hypothetical protein